jgi:hypothetical protein
MLVCTGKKSREAVMSGDRKLAGVLTVVIALQ